MRPPDGVLNAYFQRFCRICGFTTLGKRGFVGMSAAVTVRAYRPHGGSHAMALTSDSAAHNVCRLACRASGPLHQMPAAASRLRRVAPFGQKKRRSCYTFSDETRKEERTTWESIAQNRPHVHRCAVSVQNEAVEYCAHHVPRTACGARTGTGTKWRGEAFQASDVAARMCTPPRGGLCGLRNPK